MRLVAKTVGVAAAIVCGTCRAANPVGAVTLTSYCTFGDEPLSGPIYTFPADKHAQQCTDRIVKQSGLAQTFDIKAASIPNAAASIRGEKRVVYYNQEFVVDVSKKKDDWVGLGVIAHEIGHHLNGHTLKAGDGRAEMELEADRYSGFILFKLGAARHEALGAVERFAAPLASLTHPDRDARRAAVINGWIEAYELTQTAPSVLDPNKLPQPQQDFDSQVASIPSKKPRYLARLVVPSEKSAMYVTSSNDVVSVSTSGEVSLVGRRLRPMFPEFAWMYKTQAALYAVTREGKVVGATQDGKIKNVGYVTAIGTK